VAAPIETLILKIFRANQILMLLPAYLFYLPHFGQLPIEPNIVDGLYALLPS